MHYNKTTAATTKNVPKSPDGSSEYDSEECLRALKTSQPSAGPPLLGPTRPTTKHPMTYDFSSSEDETTPIPKPKPFEEQMLDIATKAGCPFVLKANLTTQEQLDELKVAAEGFTYQGSSLQSRLKDRFEQWYDNNVPQNIKNLGGETWDDDYDIFVQRLTNLLGSMGVDVVNTIKFITNCEFACYTPALKAEILPLGRSFQPSKQNITPKTSDSQASMGSTASTSKRRKKRKPKLRNVSPGLVGFQPARPGRSRTFDSDHESEKQNGFTEKAFLEARENFVKWRLNSPFPPRIPERDPRSKDEYDGLKRVWKAPLNDT